MSLRLSAVRSSWSCTSQYSATALSRARRRIGEQRRFDSTDNSRPVVYIPKCNVYRFGQPNNAPPVFEGLQWTVHEGENWAVVGSGAGEKTTLLETLRGHLRLSPPPPPPLGLFPAFSARGLDPYNCVSLVSFAHRPHSSGSGFYDYTARYGAVREEDRVTLREHLFDDPSNAKDGVEHDHELLDKLDLTRLLDLPLIALSNGQTRKARIYQAILSRPELLLLDEPLTGLDFSTRDLLLSLLHNLHTLHEPRMILGLRGQDPLPEWITHVARVENGHVSAQERAATYTPTDTEHADRLQNEKSSGEAQAGDIVVQMRNVRVSYKDRHVLKDINWTIRTGERWHLQGSNGSGKTTLLSLLTGDHPQSYTQRPLPDLDRRLELFSRPRHQLPTATLKTLVGVVSPELGNAFPRRRGMTVWEAVATGFEGTFVGAGEEGVGSRSTRTDAREDGLLGEDEENWRVKRVWEVLEALGPASWPSAGQDTASRLSARGEVDPITQTFAKREFVDLSSGEQSIVLLARALVGRQQLIILDEVWSGMDGKMIAAARRYLNSDDGVGQNQAVVVVSHWEDEVPWDQERGLRRYRLEEGRGRVVDEL
ncbi:P-loop containing nucleoside triphosphate hydrolase protein [Punctularia strigosozonata HHB-11173 SS5]|uniref:P-loop containing nucleoside triphosphate hydrolase protein n=1 Tax=Punctularia strigosozonata (strain HHB-11173) TaxID=741275 RepID=UPI0004416EB8|nr:P-loop containing nucleoside triphosphate hydrolase protein [Punctularia strigosozonata HHB-11173 SS5]EIN06385.1 P-loop containing nucleoside triphosphate hydrolase protein [Punctularia strigosozonata HHB-11173 SS5]